MANPPGRQDDLPQRPGPGPEAGLGADTSAGDTCAEGTGAADTRAGDARAGDSPGSSDQSRNQAARGLGPGSIVMLSDGGALSWITANAIAREFGPITLLREPPESKSVFIKRRIRLLGYVTVAGQLAFSILQKFVSKRSRERLRTIYETHDLEAGPNGGVNIRDIPSVNSDECREMLRDLAPKVVLVHSTRIIKRDTLSAIDAPFINYHAGINPAYRGQHGGYWARSCGDDKHAGVTIHLIDEGVDTGDVLYQAQMHTERGDNITTYQYVQAVAAVPIFIKATQDALHGSLNPRPVNLESKQWFHPTLWGYLYTGFSRGVW